MYTHAVVRAIVHAVQNYDVDTYALAIVVKNIGLIGAFFVILFALAWITS